LADIKDIIIDYNISTDLRRKLRHCRAELASFLFVAASFDFPEIIERSCGMSREWVRLRNESGNDMIGVCALNGSCNVLNLLLEQGGQEVQISEDLVKAAAGNAKNRIEVVALLLEKRGEEVYITEKVVRAAVGNADNRKEVIALLLEQRARIITDVNGVVELLVRLFNKKCVEALLKQRGEEIYIREEVVKAAAENY
jgi:hypothetical protein